MAIYQGLGAIRVRRNAEPTFLHTVCKQQLQEAVGEQSDGQQVLVLRCENCNVVVCEWPTEQDRRRELAIWVEENIAA